jgi:hypothetical protein
MRSSRRQESYHQRNNLFASIPYRPGWQARTLLRISQRRAKGVVVRSSLPAQLARGIVALQRSLPRRQFARTSTYLNILSILMIAIVKKFVACKIALGAGLSVSCSHRRRFRRFELRLRTEKYAVVYFRLEAKSLPKRLLSLTYPAARKVFCIV